jgi:hypothetical protein
MYQKGHLFFYISIIPLFFYKQFLKVQKKTNWLINTKKKRSIFYFAIILLFYLLKEYGYYRNIKK